MLVDKGTFSVHCILPYMAVVGSHNAMCACCCCRWLQHLNLAFSTAALHQPAYQQYVLELRSLLSLNSIRSASAAASMASFFFFDFVFLLLQHQLLLLHFVRTIGSWAACCACCCLQLPLDLSVAVFVLLAPSCGMLLLPYP